MTLSVKTNAQDWSLTGNAGTNTATDFIGTTDGKPLKIKTNNQVRMLIKSSGNVGVGTQTPATKLHVNGVITATGGTSSDWNSSFQPILLFKVPMPVALEECTLIKQELVLNHFMAML